MKDRPYSPPASLIAACAREPLVIVDVGARGGLQAHWQPLAEHIVWIGFEPDERSAEALSQIPARSHVLRTALTDRTGRVRLHRTRDEGDSSLLIPNRAFLRQFGNPERFDVVDTVELDGDTLDHQLASVALPKVDVIKLDTQGTELTILKGAAETLAHGVIAVDVEVEFNPLYEDQPLFGDVDACLRGHGLQLMDLAPRRWTYAAGEHLQLTKGQVVWAEAVYFPTRDNVLRLLDGRDAAGRAVLLDKIVLVALVYGFPDYAMALVDAVSSSLAPAVSAATRNAITEWDESATMPRVPVSIELTPEQVRALRAARATTGLKPTQQLRRLVQQWLKVRVQ